MGNYTSRPFRCEMCNSITSGYILHCHTLCGDCNKKYFYVPNYIPINQWAEYEKRKKEKKKCHFCDNITTRHFQFDLLNHFSTSDNNVSTVRLVSTCTTHFNNLCDTVYSELTPYKNHLPTGQREYVAIKHLETKLNVKNTIQFNS